MATLVVSPAMIRLTLGRGEARQTGSGTLPRDSGESRVACPPGTMPRWGGDTEVGRPVSPLAAEAAAPPRSVAARSETVPASVLAEQAQCAALASSCLQGNTQAWELLVRSQQRRVYGLCFRFTGSASDAEDLTQEVFLKVYRNLRNFDASKASFGVWLTALTRNLLVDHYRRSRLERASESLDEPFAGEEDGPTRAERLLDKGIGQEKHVAGVELRARVQTALARVSPELREAVILRDLEDLDYREIAGVLGIPQGTVKSRISRGRAELARLLKDMEGQVM